MMALRITRDGSNVKSDKERRAEIREQIRLEYSRGGEDRDAYIADLQKRILAYERRYERSSESMMEDLREGRIRETDEICSWVWAWQVVKRLSGETPTAGTR